MKLGVSLIPLSSERRVFLWRLRAGVTPKEASKTGGRSASLEEIVSVLEAEQGAGRARLYLSAGNAVLDDSDPERNEKNQLYIADIKRHPSRPCVSILFNRGDPRAAPASFLAPASNEVRHPRARPSEVPGWSAHLVVRADLLGGTHRCCFEQMSGVPSRLVLAGLDGIIGRALNTNPHYTYETIRKVKGKTKVEHKRYKPSLAVERVPSESLMDDVEHGQLKGVTLTKKSEFYGGVGVDKQIRRQQQKVVLALKPMNKEGIRFFMGNLLQKARDEQFEEISFEVRGLPGDQSSHPTQPIPLDDEAALEHLYVRAHRLTEFNSSLVTCYPLLCEEIVEKMIDTVMDDALWPT